MNRRYIVDGEPVFVDGSLGQELSILKGFMKAESGLAEMDQQPSDFPDRKAA